jgi:hypothetical protein
MNSSASQELDRQRDTLRTQQRQPDTAAGQRLELKAVAGGIEAFCQTDRATLATATFAQRRQLADARRPRDRHRQRRRDPLRAANLAPRSAPGLCQLRKTISNFHRWAYRPARSSAGACTGSVIVVISR